MFKKIFILILVAVAGVMFGSACETIPDDDNANVQISLSVLAPEKATGEMSDAFIFNPKYHVKITLTNPDETFYAFNWTPYEPIGLMVAATGRRVINVEVYEVNTGNPSVNSFPASFYSSAWMPAEMRTVDLSGDQSQSITLIADYYSHYGDVAGGGEVKMSDGSTYISLEFYRSCPPPTQFYANVVDLDWNGFNIFPTVPVTLAGGSYPTFEFYSIPAGHNYQFEVFHATAGTWTRAKTYIDEGMNPVTVKLGGYADPWLIFDPDKLSLNAGDDGYVYWYLRGGWGSAGYHTTTMSDTCMGLGVFMAGQISPSKTEYEWFGNPYYFVAPPMDQCLIDIAVDDCRGAVATKSMNVKITLPAGTCNNNASCDDFAGETNVSCPSDCYCGDGYCYPPFEDDQNCGSDCGF